MMRSKMKWSILVLAAIAAATGLSTTATGADDADTVYLSLFNGKDLTGWRLGKKKLDGLTETPNKKWHVSDGAIVIDGGGGGDIYTVDEFIKDFHLKLEFRAARKADSGLFIRGPQLQVRDYPRAGPYTKAKFKDDDWNELDITVKGKTALCKCNGGVIEKAFKVGATGGIGLQSESGKFEFRKIRLRYLD